MATPFRKYIESSVGTDFLQRFSDQVYSATITVGVEQLLTVPASAGLGEVDIRRHPYIVVIKAQLANSDAWVAVNKTAAVPVGATFASTTSEILNAQNPLIKYVVGGDVLHFITSAATMSISVTFYTLSGG